MGRTRYRLWRVWMDHPAIGAMCATRSKGFLWYFSIMHTKTLSTPLPVGSPKRPPMEARLGPGIAAVHAEALHRLVPPVYFDDDGYVTEDDSHMPESEVHFPIVSYWHGALYGHYRSRGRLVCVLGDHLLLVDREVGTAAVVPDVMVAFDVEPGDRLSYKVWNEPKAPDLVLEVLSADSWRVDVFRKPALYADLGVKEYWIFDPRGIRRGGPQLEGLSLRSDGEHDRMPEADSGGWHSTLLGLDLVPQGKMLWLRDPETGVVLPDHAGAMAERDRMEAERQRAEAERRRVEEENDRLRAELRQLRSGRT